MSWRGALLGLVMAMAAGGYARGQDSGSRQEARAEFNRGVERYADGDWQGALQAFQEAYRLQPHPTVRVNMANCYEQLSRPLEALFHFERFLAEAGQDTRREQRREVESALGRLRQRVGEVTLRVAPDGALVRIDGAETRRAPVVDAVRLPAGAHSIEVTLEGYQSERRDVDVPGGGRADLMVSLRRGSFAAPLPAPLPAAAAPVRVEVVSPWPQEPRAAAATPAPLPRATPSAGAAARPSGQSPRPAVAAAARPSRQRRLQSSARALGAAPTEGERDGSTEGSTTAAYVAGGVTVALGVGAAVVGIVALNANATFNDAVAASQDPAATEEERLAAEDRGYAAADRANRFATITDGLLAGTLVGVGVTTVLFLTLGGETSEGERRAGVSVAPGFSREGAALQLSGRF